MSLMYEIWALDEGFKVGAKYPCVGSGPVYTDTDEPPANSTRNHLLTDGLDPECVKENAEFDDFR